MTPNLVRIKGYEIKDTEVQRSTRAPLQMLGLFENNIFSISIFTFDN